MFTFKHFTFEHRKNVICFKLSTAFLLLKNAKHILISACTLFLLFYFVAMLDAGMGATHVNKFLTGLEVPPLSQCTIKKREREIGPMVEAPAKESCKATKEKEIALSKETGSGIAASNDAGWQRPARGRTYNSLSGHSSLVVCRTGKIIDYEVRIKSFKAFENAAKTCEKPKPHDCQKSWSASAKSTEADMAASMLKQHEENN